MIQEVKDGIQDITDDELFLVLECVSNELKRRNNILAGPSIKDIRNQSPEQNLKMVLDALSTFGVKIPPQT